MHDVPRTKAEATKTRYSVWAGEPGGVPFDNTCCAYEVPTRWGGRFRQCSRKPGHDPGELYCRQHAARVSA